MQSEPLEKFHDLITRLESVRNAVWAKKKEQALGATTDFFAFFLNVYGHSEEFMSEMSPHLKRIRNLIQSESFDDANIAVLAMLAWLRAVRQGLEEESVS